MNLSSGKSSHIVLWILSAPILLVFGVVFLPIGIAVASVCPNENVRLGKSASLPDCRAYELVSPPNTGGSTLFTFLTQIDNNVFPTELVSQAGDSTLFMTQGQPLLEPADPSGTNDQYEVVRRPDGWEPARLLTPNGQQSVFPSPGGSSQDHSYSFLVVQNGGSLAEPSPATYLSNPDRSFELLGIGSLGSERLARGRYISPTGSHILFDTGSGEYCSELGPCTVTRLEPAAPPTGTPAIYDRSPDGPTRVLSLLPGDITPAAGEGAAYQGTARNGSVVAFKIAGILYVRVNSDFTLEVTGPGATFAGIDSAGGSIFYVKGGDIFRFDIASEVTTQVNAEGLEVLTAPEIVTISSDGSHVFFISNAALGSDGTVGEPNLYVWAQGEGIKFIATVSFGDVSQLANWTSQVVFPENTELIGPGANASRATPDGKVLSFEARAQLTPYNNESFREIYRWDEADESIECASCNPSGLPPTQDARFEDRASMPAAIVVNNLNSEGNNIVFETAEPLVKRDTDGVTDIYEWRKPSDGEPSIALISSGQTAASLRPGVNQIFGVTPDGHNVVFATLDQLLASGPGNGVPALYDARVNGGFPEPLAPECQGEGCRSSGVAPDLAEATSGGLVGKGNVRRHRNRCRSHKKGDKKRSGRKKIPCHRHRKGGSR